MTEYSESRVVQCLKGDEAIDLTVRREPIAIVSDTPNEQRPRSKFVVIHRPRSRDPIHAGTKIQAPLRGSRSSSLRSDHDHSICRIGAVHSGGRWPLEYFDRFDTIG